MVFVTGAYFDFAQYMEEDASTTLSTGIRLHWALNDDIKILVQECDATEA